MFASANRRRRTTPRHSRNWQLETLESRRYLAGDVQLLTETGLLDNAAADTPVAYVATVASNLIFQPELAGFEGSLWATDGTESGTRRLNIDLTGKQILGGTEFHGRLLLATATGSTSGYTATLELWTISLVDPTVSRVKEVPNVQVPMSRPFEIVVAGDDAYFSVDTQATGSELWKTDTTEAGTGLIAEIVLGSLSAFPESLTVLGDAVFFTAHDGVVGRQIWWTDGSDLQRVTDDRFYFQGPGERREQFVAGPGFLAFTARETPSAQFSLWTTTGPLEPPTTPLVSNLGWGFSPAFPQRLVANTSGAWVVKQTRPSATELWATETGGTIARTGAFDFLISSLVATDGQAFFLDRSQIGGTVLWTSDTDSAIEGTTLPHGLTNSSAQVGELLALDARVAFSYDDRTGDLGWPGLYGNELWLSDGTEEGTFMPRDLRRARSGSGEPPGSDPTELIASTGFLFFQADNGTHGLELFSLPSDVQQRALVATLTRAQGIASPGTGSMVITVTYETDDGEVMIDSDTFGDNDLRLIGPGISRNVIMSRTSEPQPGPSPGSYQVDYLVTPPAIVWRTGNNGVYTIGLEDNQVQDTAGTSVPGGNLGVFAVAIPTAELVGADDVTTSGQVETLIEVRYDDYVDDVELVHGVVVERTGNVGIDVSTLDGSDLRVTDSTGNPFGSWEFVGSLPPLDDSPVTATYRLVPPGGGWDTSENGTYQVSLEPSQVADVDGHVVVSDAPLGTFEVAIVEPSGGPEARFLDVTDIHIDRISAAVTVTIEYHDDHAIDLLTLGDSDLRIEDGNQVALAGANLQFLSAIPDIAARTVQATYRVAPQSGSWTELQNGNYRVIVAPGEVFDREAQAVVSGAVEEPLTIDTVRPTASFSSATDIRAVGAGAELEVHYHDNLALDVNSLDDTDLTIVDGQGVAMENVDLELASATSHAGDGSILATYWIAPRDPPLTRPDHGVYTIRLAPHALFDSVGNGNANYELGQLQVGWTNPDNRFDVNGSGGDASPTDALAALNELSDFVWADPEDGSLPFVPSVSNPFFDVNGDGYVSPTDALDVLRRLDELNTVDVVPVSGAALVADVGPVPNWSPSDQQSLPRFASAERSVAKDAASLGEDDRPARASDPWPLAVDQALSDEQLERRRHRPSLDSEPMTSTVGWIFPSGVRVAIAYRLATDG